MWTSYYTYVATGSMSKARFAFAVSYATSWAMGEVGNYYGYTWNVERVALEGIIGGFSAKLNGGSFRDGFIGSAGFSLLSWGAHAMRMKMFEQSCTPETNPNCSMKGKDSVGAYEDGWKGGEAAYRGARIRTLEKILPGWAAIRQKAGISGCLVRIRKAASWTTWSSPILVLTIG